jgi:excisionase family DNA binding protein
MTGVEVNQHDQPPARSVRLLLTVEEAAEVMAISRTMMYHLIGTGQVASVRIGRLRRVSLDALREFARDNQR